MPPILGWIVAIALVGLGATFTGLTVRKLARRWFFGSDSQIIIQEPSVLRWTDLVGPVALLCGVIWVCALY